MEQAERVCVCGYANGESVKNELTNKIVLDVKNLEINQKLNSFFHQQIKAKIGLRNYLYHLQKIIFSSFSKNNLAIIGNNYEDIENVKERYHFHICEILKDTWKNNTINARYFYIQNGQMKEVVKNETFNEKPNSQVIYFNEATEKQTFENFVVSEENATALEICKSIACYSQKELVNAGSVVLLYGEAGTGKTHLINAISGFYSSQGGRVFTISSNNFVRKYGEAVKTQNVFSFQDNIIQNEIIIIDEIDQLIGKNGTLTELQKIVNLAMEENKYIVFTSKIAPNAMQDKSIILKNILANAITLKLKTQQNALKTTIAMNYICDKNMNVPISIIRDLVVALDCNVRELKNYIKKLAIVQSIRKIEINTSLAFEILADDIQQDKKKKKVITNEEIVDLVANYYNLQSNDLKSSIKQKNVCKARSIAMYLMRDINSANFQEIGKILNRNHSTIISGIKNVEQWLNEDKKLPSEIADLRSGLQKVCGSLF